MAGHGGKLGRKQEDAIAALLAQRNIDDAARACGLGARTLLKIMLDVSTPASTRVRAADSVLDHAKHAIELEDVEARVTGLERAAEAAKASHRR